MSYLNSAISDKIIPLLFLISLISSGCASNKPMPYQAKWKQHTLFYEQSPTDEVDMGSRLKFGVQNNEEKLFASVSTRDPEVISRIISSGVKLNVHPADNKKNNTRILFPVVLKQDRRAIRRMDQVELFGPSMQLLLETFNKEAVINQGSGERFVNLINNNEDLYCRINMTPDGELSIDYALSLRHVNPGNNPLVRLSLSVEGASRSGFSPGISVGMGAGGFGGMGGMGMGGVSVGTGRRNSPANQGIELKLDVNLATSPQ